MKDGRKPEYPEKTTGDELQKIPHTKAQRFKRQAEDAIGLLSAIHVTSTKRVAAEKH